MKKVKTKKGKYIVLKRNGKVHFTKKYDKDMLVECSEDTDVSEKDEKDLNKKEIKNENKK